MRFSTELYFSPRHDIEMIIEQLRHRNDPAKLITSITFIVDSFNETLRRVNNKNLPVDSQAQNGIVLVMFWGCFSWLGLGPLAAVQESMNLE